ncbi:MAG: DUF4870 domain-containing protein [Dermatophilaceae bacterium]
MTQQPQGDPNFPAYPPVDNTGYPQPGYTAPQPGYPPQQPYAAPTPNSWQTNFGDVGGSGPMTAQQERTWAMLSHVIPLALFILSAGTLGFVASLVIYLMYKDRGPFVRQNAANSLNIQIATGIGLLISVPLMFLLIGFITYPLICLWAIVLHAIAAGKANSGEWYDPPLVPKFIR